MNRAFRPVRQIPHQRPVTATGTYAPDVHITMPPSLCTHSACRYVAHLYCQLIRSVFHFQLIAQPPRNVLASLTQGALDSPGPRSPAGSARRPSRGKRAKTRDPRNNIHRASRRSAGERTRRAPRSTLPRNVRTPAAIGCTTDLKMNQRASFSPSGKCVTSAAHSDDGLKVGRGELPPAPCFSQTVFVELGHHLARRSATRRDDGSHST